MPKMPATAGTAHPPSSAVGAARAAANELAGKVEIEVVQALIDNLSGIDFEENAVGRWGGPARDLLPNTSVPFS